MDNVYNQVFSIAEKHIQEFKIRGGQLVAKYCPFCDGGDDRDKETFAIGLYNGAYNCKRGKCGEKGTIKDLYNFFGERFNATTSIEPYQPVSSKKKYTIPDVSDLFPITENIKTYFAARRISEDTLSSFKISSDKNGNIVFPFYSDGVLKYVKYRKPKKFVKGEGPKEWQMSETEQILFGMDHVSFNKPLIITEGQIDALSVYEAGISNVVSVPCGCNNFDWIQNCWEWLENFQQIILFGDNDEPGKEMVSIIMKRLGEDRCMIPHDYPQLVKDGVDFGRECKDANEILYAYGPDGIKHVIESAEPAPIKGILDLSQVSFVDPTTIPRIYTKIPSLDIALGGLAEGAITVLSGKRGCGKSTVSGPILLNAIQSGYSVCAYSGELPDYRFLEWIMLQATESKYITVRTDERTGKNFAFVPIEIQQRIRKMIEGKFYLFDNKYVSEDSEADAIIKAFEICARRFGCKLFLVDNLMTTVSSDEKDELQAQKKFLKALKAFAIRYKAHVVLVAHPRKEAANNTFGNDSVAGTSVITDIADNVLAIERPNLRITKCREFGLPPSPVIVCDYNPANRRIYEALYGDRIVYDWDHNGIELPEDRADMLQEFAIAHGAIEDDMPA